MLLPRGSVFSARVRRSAIAVFAVSGLLVSGATAAVAEPEAPDAVAATSDGVPAVPTILDVLPGNESLVISYEPSVDGSVLGYQATPDGFHWFDCPDASGTCGLVALTNGREYRPALRAVGPGGVSAPSAAVPTIPALPAGGDPDKPDVLPRPRKRVTASFNAASNGLGVRSTRTKLGVGTLPALTFSRAIPDKRAVESHLVVTATNSKGRTTKVPGAWGWTSDRKAVFRPKDYWPGNSTIRITSTLDDTVLGKSKGTYLVGAKSLGTIYSFRTDRSLIAEVNGATKRMKVFINGKEKKDFPVSLGKSGWESRNGAKVISTDKEAFKVYRSESLGLTDPEDQYELDAPWNTRLTPTGEFLHTASWAYGRLGRYNGSHGCTNMYEKDAKWIFDNTIPGDVVVYRKTGGELMEPWNGPGGLWNISWNKWLKKSALGSGTGAADTSMEQGSVADARPASA